MKRTEILEALQRKGKGWPSRSASARPFCLVGAVLLMLVAGCLPFRPAPRFEVEGIEEGFPVQGENQLGLRLYSTFPRSLVARLEGTSPSGERWQHEQRLSVPGRGASRFELRYRVREVGVHVAALKIYDLPQGILVHAVDNLRLVVRPRWEFTQDRSYYTGERVIRFRVRLNRSEEVGRQVVVVLRGKGTAIPPLTLNLRHWQVEGQFAAAGLPTGRYEMVARLCQGGRVEDSLKVAFRRYPPAAREVKIDQFSQSLLVDGKPFFPIGLYWLRTEVLAKVQHLGFNTGDYYYRLRAKEIAELMDAAAREGVQILLELSDFIRRRQVPDYAAIEATVEQYRRHPALLAWYLIDEPEETGVRPEVTRKLYERLQELDPYHPVYLVNNRPRTYAAHIQASDILAIDVYPVPRYPLTRVRDYLQEARWASGGRKPVWLIAQAFGGVEHWPRPPTPAELRNMVYQGVVQGARGILFYRYCQEEERHLQPPELWQEVCALAAELARLAPVLVEPEGGDQVRLLDGGSGVEVMLREHGKDYYLLAVNTTPSSRRARLLLRGLPPIGGVEALYPAPLPRLRGGALEVELGPLGVGVYRLETAEI